MTRSDRLRDLAAGASTLWERLNGPWSPEESPESAALADSPILLTIDDGNSPDADTWAWWSDGRAAIGERRDPPAVALLSGTRTPGPETRAAFGLGGGGQFLFYAEIATAPRPGEDAELLSKALRAAGADQLAFMRDRPTLSSRGEELSGHPHTPSKAALNLRASPTPEFRLLFKDTPIVERAIWRALQKSGH